MEALYTYYKAIRHLLELVTKNDVCDSNVYIIKNSDSDNDRYTKTNFEVVIDEDWIDTIEEKLIYIERCIKEERQFILRNGEVVNIEKANNVSRESVSHLARHSNLVSQQKDDEIYPKKLFIAEKETDYAIYENKFIYFLLCYLKDFIDSRYIEILKYQKQYEGYFKMQKEVKINNFYLDYNISFNQSMENDQFTAPIKNNEAIINRIEDIYHAIIAYLNTPLMVEVSKTSMIKEPITVTNVLKMNQNFKGAFELYTYVAGYDKKGYSINEVTQKRVPLSSEQSYVFSTLIGLYSSIAYIYNNNLIKKFRDRYNEEIFKEKEDLIARNKREVKVLKTMLESEDISIDDYVVKIEKENKILNERVDSLTKKLNEIDILQERVSKYKENLKFLNHKLDDKDDLIMNLEKEHKDEIDEINLKNTLESKDVEESHQNLINLINFQNEFSTRTLTEKLAFLEKENNELKEILTEKNEENLLLKAKLNNQRFLEEDLDLQEELKNEEKFKELEEELKVLKQLIKKQWKITKKSIVKDVKKEYKFKKNKE